MRRRLLGVAAAWFLLAGAATATIAACQPTLQQETGVVIRVDGTSPVDIQDFVLHTPDGRLVTFAVGPVTFDQQSFPPQHLREHQALATPIVVTYRRDGDTLVAVKLADAPTPLG